MKYGIIGVGAIGGYYGTVALNTRTDLLLKHASTRQLIRDMMMEVVCASRALGVSGVDEAFVEKMISTTDAMTPYSPSMKLDFDFHLKSMGLVWCFSMSCASPSTMALLPTPGSPINIGLFFFLRPRISMMRCISFSRPTQGSSLPSAAACVRSVPKVSRTGVFERSMEIHYLYTRPIELARAAGYHMSKLEMLESELRFLSEHQQ